MSWAFNFRFDYKEWESPINTTQRRAFRAHLEKVAKAIEAIERFDEYHDKDAKSAENLAICDCLQPSKMLEQATIDAREAKDLLEELLLLTSKAGNKQ